MIAHSGGHTREHREKRSWRVESAQPIEQYELILAQRTHGSVLIRLC